MPELHLGGCRPEPLGSYLKALGVLRLVSEQSDATAEGCWRGGSFVVRSSLDADALMRFFLDASRPTPFVSPWNRGSGFYPNDQQAGISAIEASTSPRLASYRETIALARDLVAAPDWPSLDKQDQVRRCRAVFPDEAVRWLDAAVVLTTDGREFPPLLGTGGNVGRLEFSNNVMQRVVEVMSVGDDNQSVDRPESGAWLEASLQSTGHPRLVKAATGQFDPGGTGGANSDPTDASGVSLVNPWDFILMFEGTLLFASGAARRMGAGNTGKAAMPFMVDATAAGYASNADDESNKGELWAPLWQQPATYREIDRLLAEGRSEWRGRQARTGLDFARAVATLGTDRGVDQFVRHAFVERHGQNILAVPVSRVRVSTREMPSVRLTGQLDRWLASLHRATELTAGARAALVDLEREQYALARDTGAEGLQRVLRAAARLDRIVERSGSLRAKVDPLRVGPAGDWVEQLDDGSPELRLAVALTSQRDRRGSTGEATPALMLRAVSPSRGGRRLEWVDRVARVPGLGQRGLAPVLAALLEARTIECLTHRRPLGQDGSTEQSQGGVNTAYDFATPAVLGDLVAFLDGGLDDSRLEDLIAACLLLDYGPGGLASFPQPEPDSATPIQPALALLAPFYCGHPIAVGGARRTATLTSDPGWPSMLNAGPGQVGVFCQALQRLRVAELAPLQRNPERIVADVDTQRLAATLTFPISRRGSAALLSLVACAPDQLIPTPGGPA